MNSVLLAAGSMFDLHVSEKAFGSVNGEADETESNKLRCEAEENLL